MEPTTELLVLRGEAQLLRGNFQEASQHFNTVLQQDPNNHAAREGMQKCQAVRCCANSWAELVN